MIQSGQNVRVSKAFIEANLSAGAVKVIFLLASIAQVSNSSTITITNSRIAERTGLTNITRIMNELYAAGAVSQRIERYKDNRRKCNAYVVADELLQPADFCFVPVSALELPKNALRMLILLSLQCNCYGRCLLSLAQLQSGSGLARGTVIECIKTLQEYGYIAKQRYRTAEGDYGHNRIYVTHILRRCHTMRTAEVLRVLINNSAEMNYDVKSELEYIIKATKQRAMDMLRSQIKALFRSTRVPCFLRRLLRRITPACFFYKDERSRKMTKRLLDLFPVLNI